MGPAVARQERDPPAADGADHERRAGRSERGVEGDLFDVLEERIEARASEDADLCFRHEYGSYADFDSDDDVLPEDESFDDESDEELFDSFDSDEPEPDEGASADFFDGAHYVMKGASPVTARHLVRRSFRNWFRPNYPYVYAAFRCVT